MVSTSTEMREFLAMHKTIFKTNDVFFIKCSNIHKLFIAVSHSKIKKREYEELIEF